MVSLVESVTLPCLMARVILQAMVLWAPGWCGCLFVAGSHIQIATEHHRFGVFFFQELEVACQVNIEFHALGILHFLLVQSC